MLMKKYASKYTQNLTCILYYYTISIIHNLLKQKKNLDEAETNLNKDEMNY